MNVMDLADTLGVEIKWERKPNDKGWVTCWLADCVMRKPDNASSWISFIGRGKSPREALTQLTENLKGVKIAYESDLVDGIYKGKKGMIVPKSIEA